MGHCQMTEGPTGPHCGIETWSNKHNYGVLNAVCANMHWIIMRPISILWWLVKNPESASNSMNVPSMHFTVFDMLQVWNIMYVWLLCLQLISSRSHLVIAKTVASSSQTTTTKRRGFWFQNVSDVKIPVMVSANAPDTDAANWLRVEQTSIIWVN